MSLPVQFYTMLAMIGMGSYFGAALDTYQRFLKRKRRKKWLVFLNDILFWLFQGLIIFYVLFLVNYGELRFYLILALLCGFAAYQALLKYVYLKFLELAIKSTILTFNFLQKTIELIIYRPIKGIILFIVSLVVLICKALLTLVKIVSNVLLWVLKILLKPFVFIGGLFWKMVPISVKKTVGQLMASFAGYIKFSKNKFSSTFKAIHHFFRNKR